MLFGLGLGLVIALGVYLKGPRAPLAATPQPTSASAASPRVRQSPPAATEPPPRAQAAAPAESRFDFYEILPQFEVTIPTRGQPPARSAETAPAPVPVAAAAVPSRIAETTADGGAAPDTRSEAGRYVVQAGSFTSPDDADRLQASLALVGIESRIERVTIADATYHRVRIGPVGDAQLGRIETQLRERQIDPLVMRAAD